MTPAAAETLAVKISQTWPKGPPVDVWVEDITDLDEGAAGTAFVKLRRESQYPPTIAQFRATTLSLKTVDASNRREPCPHCDDSGWVDAPDRIWPDERHSTQVQPCECREGRQRAASRIWTERNPPKHGQNAA